MDSRDDLPPYTPEGGHFTGIALEVFRLNGLLVAAGDRLGADFGLTSARWKVLGAIGLEGRPLTVAQIARRMGLARQSVQRIVTELKRDGLVLLAPNPDHRRSPRVARTPSGDAAYRAVMMRYAGWANDIAAGVPAADLAQSLAVLKTLSDCLDESAGDDS